jgi:formimidoylglutamate deiminase
MTRPHQPEPATILQFSAALLEHGWQDHVLMKVSQSGWIQSIYPPGSDAQPDEIYDAVALPGMVNVHSHAFQRAFAGLSEFQTGQQDSFWTWRSLMYEFVSKLSPDDIYLIARQLYLEMLLAGYTWVGEFHYLHHDLNGKRYSRTNEISKALLRAARETGIGLCLIPTLYQRGGFDDQRLQSGQKRFELANDEMLELVDSLPEDSDPSFNLGIALHSLRAVSIDAARSLLAAIENRRPDCPIHLHIAEQRMEVSDCIRRHAKRPVALLFDRFSVGPNWCLIHATHLDEAERDLIAQSGAVVGLCPTTEANLGDGFFPARPYLDSGGKIAIGSDSHCSIDFREELRLLEYGHRLRAGQRAVLGSSEQSVGRRLYQLASQGGGQAIGVATGVIAEGNRADLTLIDRNHPAIAGASNDRLIDRLIFCNADDPVIGVIVGGQLVSMDDPATQELVFRSEKDFLRLSQSFFR